MSDNDRDIIKQSFETRDWNVAYELEQKAESDDAKEIIRDRKNHLYRREEMFAGIL